MPDSQCYEKCRTVTAGLSHISKPEWLSFFCDYQKGNKILIRAIILENVLVLLDIKNIWRISRPSYTAIFVCGIYSSNDYIRHKHCTKMLYQYLVCMAGVSFNLDTVISFSSLRYLLILILYFRHTYLSFFQTFKKYQVISDAQLSTHQITLSTVKIRGSENVDFEYALPVGYVCGQPGFRCNINLPFQVNGFSLKW